MSRRNRGIGRREFLGRAAAIAAAPYVLSASVLGQRSERRRRESVAPSDRVGVGIIGVGRRGLSWATALAQPGPGQCVAICDVDSRKTDAAMKYISRRQQSCRVFKDYRRLLEDGSVDAVVICTPDHWHGIIACEAARACKDIFCETPLSLTVREAAEMASAARRYGRVFQTGTYWRSNAGYRAACELVSGKRLGEVKTVHVQAGLPSRHCSLGAETAPKELDWEMWLGPAPEAPYHSYRCASSSGGSYGWRAWRDYCGGYLASYGSQYFDAVQWALGMDQSGPVEVIPPDGKDHPALTLRYANGVTVYNTKGPKGAIVEFTGSDGVLGIGIGRRGYQTWPEGLVEPAAAAARDSSYYWSNDHMGDFLRCVKTRGRCASDVEIARRSVTVCHLGCIAYWLGRPLKWDPVKEEIVGDPEASRWLDRPKRAPWRL